MLDKYKIEIKWSIIFVVAMLLWMCIERLAGFHDERIESHPIFTMIFIIPAVLLYVFALKDKKKNYYNGQMNFKQGFMTGLIIAIILTILSPLTQWVISNVITPHYFDNVIAYTVEHGHMDQDEAEAYFNYNNYAVQSTISALIMGAITSAIVAFFVRTKSS